ncbi:hypothetical protein ACJBV0_10590, partial [Streptococcus suis]
DIRGIVPSATYGRRYVRLACRPANALQSGHLDSSQKANLPKVQTNPTKSPYVNHHTTQKQTQRP